MIPQPEPEIVEEIKAANQRFYDAFSDLDIAGMDRVWDNSERAMCVHPGWSPLVGWESVRMSWERIFQNTALMQFQVRYLNVVVQGEFGFVTCVEGITSVVQAPQQTSVHSLPTYLPDIPTAGAWLLITLHREADLTA